jgi:hypothetical protein
VGGLAGAWLAGVGIVAWREVRQSGHMPVPAALLGVTGLFAALSLIADMAPASRRVVTLAAWGLDLAGFMNILPNGLFGQVQAAQSAEDSAQTGSSSSSSIGEAV